MLFRRSLRYRYARRKAQPYRQLRTSIREIFADGIIATAVVARFFSKVDAVVNLAQWAVVFVMTYLAFPWFEYAVYWWLAPTPRQRATERQLRALSQSYRLLVQTVASPLRLPSALVVPEPPPDLRYVMFDGENAGVEVINKGGECRIAAMIQILTVGGHGTVLRVRERRAAVFINSPKTANKGVILKRNQSAQLVFGTFTKSNHGYGEYRFAISGWDGHIEYWSFDPNIFHQRKIDSARIRIEVTTEPETEGLHGTYILTLDHSNKVITLAREEEAS